MARSKSNAVDAQANAVAEALGVDVRTVYRWKDREGAPPLADVDGWKEYAETQGIAPKGLKNAKGINGLREELLREQIRTAKLKNSQLEGESIPQGEVRQFCQSWATKLDLLLTMKLETEGPAKCVGKSAAELRLVFREIHDEIRGATEKGLLQWKPQT